MKKLGPGLFWASILVAVFVLLWALSYGIAGFLGIDSLGCTPGDRACFDLRAVDLSILALRLEAVGIASSRPGVLTIRSKGMLHRSFGVSTSFSATQIELFLQRRRERCTTESTRRPEMRACVSVQENDSAVA